MSVASIWADSNITRSRRAQCFVDARLDAIVSKMAPEACV